VSGIAKKDENVSRKEASIRPPHHSIDKSSLINKSDSRSVDFQVTYLEEKKESFYKKGNLTNATNFLKSTNVTTIEPKHPHRNNNTTRFINEKSQLAEKKLVEDLNKKQVVSAVTSKSLINKSHVSKNNRSKIEESLEITQKAPFVSRKQKGAGGPYPQFPEGDEMITMKRRGASAL